MYKSWRTGDFFCNSGKTDHYFAINRSLNGSFHKEKYKSNRRPIIIQETCANSSYLSKSINSNLPFNYENVINNYKKILDEQISNNLNTNRTKQQHRSTTNYNNKTKKTLENKPLIHRNFNNQSSESLNSIGSSNSSFLNDSSSLTSVSTSASVSSSSKKRFIVTEKLPQTKDMPINEFKKKNHTDADLSVTENYKELTEDDIEFLMDNTGFNCEQIRRWHLEFLNKCSTGLIKYDQFKAYYKVLLPKSLCDESKEEIVLRLFQLFDIDADGSLNFTEFLISFWIRCKAPIREKFTWVFNMLDLDRNGYLNYHEIKNALSLCLNVDTLDSLLEELNTEVYGSNDFTAKINESTEEKLQQVILLLNILSPDCNNKRILFEDNLSKSHSKLCGGSSEESDSLKSTMNRIQLTRENFIDLAEKFKLLRKLVLPIHNFYEDAFLNE